MLVSFDNVTFGYGDNVILSDVSFSVNEGERIGLIGANGEGKTTLLELLTGGLIPEKGDIYVKNGVRIGYLEQNGGYAGDNTAYGEMRKVFSADYEALENLSRLSERLSALEYGSAEYAAVASKIENLEKFVSSRDSYGVDVKIKTVLNGMGFSSRYSQVIDTMSGGEKTRLKLCRLLLEEPDLLVLDEPTNHLDMRTLFWLEDYLKTFKGAILVVSHDRYFLDRTVSRTLEIENRALVSYPGNYSAYKILAEQRRARLLKEYEALQKERARLQDYVDRNIVRATTAKSAQSRVKKLAKMDMPEKPYMPPKPPVFGFSFEEKPYENVLTVKDLTLSAGGKTLLKNVDFRITRGAKVALVGENGAGKTTFLREIMRGNRAVVQGRFVKPAFYDQEGLNLNGEETVLSEFRGRHTGASQTEVRALLARAGLFEEDMQKQVKSLSGGERAKFALAVLEAERGNFLVLDEPTNHLDLPARESLENALKEFGGTLLFVSHDRYFLSAVAEKVAEIAGGQLKIYDCGYDEYINIKNREAAAEPPPLPAANSKSAFHRTREERSAETKRKERMAVIEKLLSEIEEEEKSINAELAEGSVLSDYKKTAALYERLGFLGKRSEELYAEYGELL